MKDMRLCSLCVYHLLFSVILSPVFFIWCEQVTWGCSRVSTQWEGWSRGAGSRITGRCWVTQTKYWVYEMSVKGLKRSSREKNFVHPTWVTEHANVRLAICQTMKSINVLHLEDRTALTNEMYKQKNTLNYNMTSTE